MAINSNVGKEKTALLCKAIWLAGLAVGTALFVEASATVLPHKMFAMAMALPLLVGYFVLTLVRFDLAVLLLIFFAPLVPPSVGVELSPSLPLITIQRLMLVSLYVALVVRVAANRFILRLPRIPRVIWLTLALYFGASVISSLPSTLFLKSLYRVLTNLFDNIGLFVIIAHAAVYQRSNLFAKRALTVLWTGLVILALLGLVDTLTGFNPLYYLPAARGNTLVPVFRLGIQRGQGLLPNPTALGMVTAMGAMLTILLIVWRKKAGVRIGLWLTMLLFIAAMVGTMTRTGWIAFGIGVIIWLLLTKRIRIQLVLIILGLCALIVSMGIGTTLYSVIASGFDFSQQNEVATLFSRVQWASVVWTNVSAEKVRLLLGFGPGSVEFLTAQWSYPGFRANLTTDYVIRLAEGGLVGLLSFILLLFVSVSQCRRLIRSADPWVRNVGIFLFIAFIQIALGSVTLPIFVWAQTTYLFWILLGTFVTVHPSKLPHLPTAR